MQNPNNSFSREELRKLLDRLADVHPKCMPDGKWAVADPEARRSCGVDTHSVGKTVRGRKDHARKSPTRRSAGLLKWYH
jgi:hypothetical protein